MTEVLRLRPCDLDPGGPILHLVNLKQRPRRGGHLPRKAVIVSPDLVTFGPREVPVIEDNRATALKMVGQAAVRLGVGAPPLLGADQRTIESGPQTRG